MDASFCVFISPALWLEMAFSHGNPNTLLSPYLFSFCDDVSIPGGGRKTKEIVQSILGQRIFKRPEFQSIIGEGGNADEAVGLLGSHSIRKFAATRTHCPMRNVVKQVGRKSISFLITFLYCYAFDDCQSFNVDES
jgi:hypothetical protein